MFTVETFRQLERVNTDSQFRITEKANQVKAFIDAIEKRIPFESEELQHDLGQEIFARKVNGEGLFALARVAIGAPRPVYNEVRKSVLLRMGDFTDPHPLTPRFVDGLWLRTVELQEHKNELMNKRDPTKQTEVLVYLFNRGYDVHPALTFEELSDIIAKGTQLSDKRFIPTYANEITKRYDKPPYEMIYAQLVLVREQDVCDAVAGLIDKRLVGRPFAEMPSEDQDRMIFMFMPYYEKGLPVGSTKINKPKLR